MPAGPRARVIELAALPGTGKTTLCALLAARSDGAMPSWVGASRRWLRRLRIERLFAPRVRQRYGALLGEIADAASREEAVRILGRLHAESLLLEIESRLRRRTLIVDEGFVQRAVSLALRAPESSRARLWQGLLAGAPPRRICVVLHCEPSEALRRAESRARGLSKILRSAEPGSGVPRDLPGTYTVLAGWLTDPEDRGGPRRSIVGAEGSPGSTADALLERLAALAPQRKLAVLVREKSARVTSGGSGI